jgi:hypothetical protein
MPLQHNGRGVRNRELETDNYLIIQKTTSVSSRNKIMGNDFGKTSKLISWSK